MGFVTNYLANLWPVLRGRHPTRPLLFSYYVTHRCGLGCTYCSDGTGQPFRNDPVAELSTSDACRLFDVMLAETDTIDITGGEPLVRHDLEDLLSHIRRRGGRTVLNTKGIGLEDRPDVARHTDVMVLSVDSLDPARLARLLGGDRAAAHRVLAALDYALSHRGAGGPQWVIAVVATPDNLDDIDHILTLCCKHGLGFQFSPQLVGRDVHPGLLVNNRYRWLVGKIYRAKHAGHAVLGVRGYWRRIADFAAFPCYPLLMPTVRPDGAFAFPCLDRPLVTLNLLSGSGYAESLARLRREHGAEFRCPDHCHIFCHLATSQLQTWPVAALREAMIWSRIHA